MSKIIDFYDYWQTKKGAQQLLKEMIGEREEAQKISDERDRFQEHWEDLWKPHEMRIEYYRKQDFIRYKDGRFDKELAMKTKEGIKDD